MLYKYMVFYILLILVLLELGEELTMLYMVLAGGIAFGITLIDRLYAGEDR